MTELKAHSSVQTLLYPYCDPKLIKQMKQIGKMCFSSILSVTLLFWDFSFFACVKRCDTKLRYDTTLQRYVAKLNSMYSCILYVQVCVYVYILHEAWCMKYDIHKQQCIVYAHKPVHLSLPCWFLTHTYSLGGGKEIHRKKWQSSNTTFWKKLLLLSILFVQKFYYARC